MKDKRYITGFEVYISDMTADQGSIEYSLIHFDKWFDQTTGKYIPASTEEILLAANILHCLRCSGINPRMVVLSQDMSNVKWFTGCSVIKITVEIHT